METDTQFLEATWGRVLRIWWSLVWRSMVFSSVAGGIR
jgi:hypothetical protein